MPESGRGGEWNKGREGQSNEKWLPSHQCQFLAVSLRIFAIVHRRNESVPLELLSEALNIRVDRDRRRCGN